MYESTAVEGPEFLGGTGKRWFAEGQTFIDMFKCYIAGSTFKG